MFSCNRYETKVIMDGKSSGMVRQYGDICPHEVGAEIVLTSSYLTQDGKALPFARATVTSVRPGSVGEFRRDPMLYETDGYKNGEHWFGNMSQMYRGIKDTDKMFHISFRLIEIDKQAGTRSQVEKVEK